MAAPKVDVREITIAQLHQGYTSGSFSTKDIISIFLDRIDKLDKNGSPPIRSTMAVSSTALDEAAALDAHLKQEGKLKGPLHGIPVLVKDQADTKGLETTYSSVHCKGNVPDKDAFVVQRLREQGAVVLAKTTMSEWASTWFSSSSSMGWEFTENPYGVARGGGWDVGGSSSGTGAGIAANFGVLGVGEDTGGSVRIPSSFNNLVGLRPTPGLISRTGFCPLVKTQDTPGPMARTVTDCAIMLDSMVGYDPEDEWTGVQLLTPPPKGGYAADLNTETIKSSRIGVVRQLFGPDSDPQCKAVNDVLNASLDKLAAAGTTVIDVKFEGLEEYMSSTPTYEQRSRTDINSFLAKKPHLFQDIASIIPKEPPKKFLEFTSKVAHGPLDPHSDPSYAKKLADRDEFHRKLLCLFSSQKLDALAFPSCRITAPRHEDSDNGRFPTLWSFPVNTLLASQARLPSISVPAGLSEEGMPVGLEIVSWDFREKALLDMARGVEDIVKGRKAPPAPL